MSLERSIMDHAEILDHMDRPALAMWYRCQVQELAVEWRRTGVFPLPTP